MTAITPERNAKPYNIQTACRSESPRATRRCDVWSRPPREAARPESLRKTVTKVVSKMGMKRMRMGTARTGRKLRERPPDTFTRAELARKNPMHHRPQSPMNIEDGRE